MAAYCGIDWAEGHHDIAVVDDQGTLLAKRRVDESPAGLAELIALLVGIGDDVASPVPVAIETPRGLLVAALRATGRPIYPINPMAVATQLRQDPIVESAMRAEALVLLGVLDAACGAADALAVLLAEAFRAHPDYTIITSFPGLADISGAIVLAEVGDDRSRFADHRSLQAFAGSAPITRASGSPAV